ncbi:auxin-responsive protein IAA11 isoform X1 [Cucumis melo var. makuwa]|uniref:Auxin-responsive protein IAA11 isoform X1 n=1 Tax=Cucumis melo var. makuwa TaxID=1194695 RepID=A0A5D3D634_CUCMM|nr:auxin-responsive protein IAA11 isoform X1 [Cucumis melo var. makuwa]
MVRIGATKCTGQRPTKGKRRRASDEGQTTMGKRRWASDDEQLTMAGVDDNMVLSSEDSSSPDESEIELGLGLCLGVRDSPRNIHKTSSGGIQFRRILTAEDFPSSISSSSSSTSSVCSSSSLRGVNVTDGSNTNSDSSPTTNGGRYLY